MALRQLSVSDLKAVSETLEGKPPLDVLGWALEEFSPELALACSFGGPTGMVLLDMLSKLGALNGKAHVFYLETGFLFPETHALREEVEDRYGFKAAAYSSDISLEQMAEKHGPELWARDSDLCCEIRKVEPNARALVGMRAWLSGIRRDQASTRRETAIVDWDAKFNLAKVSPLVAWSEAQVWTYIVENRVPYNALHDRGYPSIGCMPCTRPVKPGEDPRAGRWAGTDKTECGLHVQPK
ncbi:MAG: phosphoadenylyl-sulfate reductase [Chloroflexi bacterium]|nr:phosphoadenylyl-sulfate reductase [Chloroflexota bacterium]